MQSDALALKGHRVPVVV